MVKVCNFIAKYSLYALVFLMPIFFLPWTRDALDFNKQFLLLILVFISLFSWLIKILISGKLEIKKSFINVVAGFLFLAYFLSTIFSVYRYGSFWGSFPNSSQSLVSIIFFLLFCFLAGNIFSKKDLFISAGILSASAAVSGLVGVFDFIRSATFNTVGSAGSLGFFAATLLPLAISMLICARKWWKILFSFVIIICGLVIFLVNFSIIWWVVLAGSVLLLALGILRKNIFDNRWLALPMFFLLVSLFFLIFNIQASWVPQQMNEVLLSQKSGLDIAGRTMAESPVFGSGPGNFGYDFLKFKSPDFSKTSMWNVTFNNSSSEILNSLTTTGILGLLALLIFMLLPIFYGLRFLFSKQADNSFNVLLAGLLVALATLCVAYFLYNSNMTLNFVFFFLIAGIFIIISNNKKEYILKSSSLTTLIITFTFTLVFIFGMGLLALSSQKYLAEVRYYKALGYYQSGDRSSGLKNLEAAANLNPESDLYFRQLAQAYLSLLQNESQKEKIQTLVSNSINAAKLATDLNPRDVSNWYTRGFVYQSLTGILADASKWAIISYDSGLKIDPNDPYLFAQEGNVYFSSKMLTQAKTQLEKAITLNPNYSDAIKMLKAVNDSLAQKSK